MIEFGGFCEREIVQFFKIKIQDDCDQVVSDSGQAAHREQRETAGKKPSKNLILQQQLFSPQPSQL